jgi:serine/threonine protein kinase
LLARDLQTEELVAIKILSFGADFQWDDLKLFEREAETLQSLSHPAIPRYLDHFEFQTPKTKWQLVSSTALELEIAKTPDLLRRQWVMASLEIAQTRLVVTTAMLDRAKELVALSFKSFDALHLSCAESTNVDVFLTTDDRLLRKALANQAELKVAVANPVQWFMEISQAEGENA